MATWLLQLDENEKEELQQLLLDLVYGGFNKELIDLEILVDILTQIENLD